ncbi:archease [Candidatus Nitrospira bockiana]
MAASFRFLDDVAVADAAFEATGDSPSELFTAAAQAVVDTMVDPQTVLPARRRTIEREDPALDALLFDWLSDIVFYKDVDGMVLRSAQATVSRDDARDTWRLQGVLEGETIDATKHSLRADIKAVTKHLYELRRDGPRWTARVVVDI